MKYISQDPVVPMSTNDMNNDLFDGRLPCIKSEVDSTSNTFNLDSFDMFAPNISNNNPQMQVSQGFSTVSNFGSFSSPSSYLGTGTATSSLDANFTDLSLSLALEGKTNQDSSMNHARQQLLIQQLIPEVQQNSSSAQLILQLLQLAKADQQQQTQQQMQQQPIPPPSPPKIVIQPQITEEPKINLTPEMALQLLAQAGIHQPASRQIQLHADLAKNLMTSQMVSSSMNNGVVQQPQYVTASVNTTQAPVQLSFINQSDQSRYR